MAEKRQLVPNSKKLLHTNPSLAAQFPPSFVFNEVLDKWIPEGWGVKSLGEIAVFGNGKTSPKRIGNAVYPVYGSNGQIGRF
jgi:type I restriction enzyme S subunit